MDKRAKQIGTYLKKHGKTSVSGLRDFSHAKSDMETLHFICEVMDDEIDDLCAIRHNKQLAHYFESYLSSMEEVRLRNLEGIDHIVARLKKFQKKIDFACHKNAKKGRKNDMFIESRTNLRKVNSKLKGVIDFLCLKELSFPYITITKESLQRSLIELYRLLYNPKLNQLTDQQKKRIQKDWAKLMLLAEQQRLTEGDVQTFKKQIHAFMIERVEKTNVEKNPYVLDFTNRKVFAIDTKQAIFLEDAFCIEWLPNRHTYLHIFIFDCTYLSDDKYCYEKIPYLFNQEFHSKQSFSFGKNKVQPALMIRLEFDENDRYLGNPFLFRAYVKLDETFSYEDVDYILETERGKTDEYYTILKKAQSLSQHLICSREKEECKIRKRKGGETIVEVFINTTGYVIASLFYEKNLPAIYRRNDIEDKISYNSLKPGPHRLLRYPVYCQTFKPSKNASAIYMLHAMKEFLIDRNVFSENQLQAYLEEAKFYIEEQEKKKRLEY